MNRPECPRHENIIRAITTPHWDNKKRRPSSDLFKGPNTSVSRLAILSLIELFKIFYRDLHKTPRIEVLGAGEINVGRLKDIGTDDNPPKNIIVEIDPLADNPAHAKIPQKISRALALRIISKLEIHNNPFSE